MAVKEEKPSQSPVLPPSPFSPVMRQDTHKPASKHSEFFYQLHRLSVQRFKAHIYSGSQIMSTGLDPKPLDGSRTASRLPDSPAPPISQQDSRIKQEPKTPIASKKTQVCMSVLR